LLYRCWSRSRSNETLDATSSSSDTIEAGGITPGSINAFSIKYGSFRGYLPIKYVTAKDREAKIKHNARVT